MGFFDWLDERWYRKPLFCAAIMAAVFGSCHLLDKLRPEPPKPQWCVVAEACGVVGYFVAGRDGNYRWCPVCECPSWEPLWIVPASWLSDDRYIQFDLAADSVRVFTQTGELIGSVRRGRP